MSLLTCLRVFQLANEPYANATVTAYKVDALGNRLGTLATLYDAPAGGTVTANPFRLDSDGKVKNPIYFGEPIILNVVGINVPSHDTGVVGTDTLWRGNYTTGTIYYPGNVVQDAATKRLYVVTATFTATSLAADVGLGRLTLTLDTAAVLGAQVTRHTATGDGVTTAFTLPVTPANTASVWVSVSGLQVTNWTLAGAVVTFAVAPANTAPIVFNILAGSGTSWLTDQNQYRWMFGGTAGGTADALTLTPVPPITARLAGQTLEFLAAAANTGAATLNVSGLGAAAIVRPDGTALSAGDIPAAGRVCRVVDNGTSYVLVTPATQLVAASTITPGAIEIATQAEVITGTDTARAVVPSTLRGLKYAVRALTGAYTVLSADNREFFTADGTFSIAFQPAATLASGHEVEILNIGTGIVTLDPDGAELINGAASVTLGPGEAAMVVCTGTAFRARRTNGAVVKVATSEVATNVDLATAIPFDDTIPTNAEGTEIFSITTTLQAPTSIVRIRPSLMIGHAGGGAENITCAAFRGTTCVGVICLTSPPAYVTNLSGEIMDTPGTVGPHTYSLRLGATAAAVRLNGTSAARRYGGAAKSVMTLEEIRA